MATKTENRWQPLTRDGLKVRIYAQDGGGAYPIHGAVKVGGLWEQTSWTKEGREYTWKYSEGDLLPMPKTRTKAKTSKDGAK